MYGQELGLPATGFGGFFGVAGIATSSMILGAIALMLLAVGAFLLLINHARRKGARP